MAITNKNYWPLGSTVQKIPNYTITDLYNGGQTVYEHFGLLSVNPINGHMIMMYRSSSIHMAKPSSLVLRRSTNGGATWSTEYTVLPISGNIDYRAAVGGYDSNGNLYIFFANYDCTSNPLANPPIVPHYVSMNYIYSTDDGATWSTPPQLIPTPESQSSQNSCSSYLPFGNIIDIGNNTLFQPWYGKDTSGYWSIKLAKSIDGGISFPYTIHVYTSPNVSPSSTDVVEPVMANLGGGCFLILARTASPQFHQFISTDNCNNWTFQGKTNFDTRSYSISNTPDAPPFLSYINYEGVGIVACYYARRDYYELNVVFGLASDLLDINNGNNAWKTVQRGISASGNPLYGGRKIYSYAQPSLSGNYSNNGYQSFFHPLNQFKGIGLSFDAPNFNHNFPPSYPVINFTNDWKVFNPSPITGFNMFSVLRDLGL